MTTGATTATGGNGSAPAGVTSACGSAAEDAPLVAGMKRIAVIAPTAPKAAAARIQSERGRSRTTMTVGSCAPGRSDVMLTGATEPNAPAFATATDDGSDPDETGYA